MPSYQSSIIKFSELCALAKVQYMRLYRRKQGLYKSVLSLEDRTKLANALLKDIKPFIADLGYDVSISAKKG